jgi:MFS family permease
MGSPTPLAPDPRRWRSLPIILLASFMALFDVFVVNVAAPSIERDLGASSPDTPSPTPSGW